MFSYDIGNAYLNSKFRGKLWTEAGTEFGNEKGMVMIISRALYVLEISGAAWRAKIAETLMSLRYKPYDTCSIPRRTFFLHALSFEYTSKLCVTFLNQFLVYFHIKKMHNTI